MADSDDRHDPHGGKAPRRRRRLATGAAAALAALVLVAPACNDRAARPPEPGLVEVVPAATIRAGELVRWKPVPGAARYAVEAFTADGAPAWGAQVPETEVDWPAGGARPASYRYRVVAMAEDGHVLARSAMVTIQVTP